MPKIEYISYKNNLEDFIEIETVEALANNIGKVRAKLEQIKEELNKLSSTGNGFDPEAFVIDGEPLLYNKILRQIKNIEIIIFDLQREENWIFKNGKKHRLNELTTHIQKIDEKIEDLGTISHPGSFENYNGTLEKYNDDLREYNKWYKQMYGSVFGGGGDGLVDKKRKSKNAKDKLGSVSYDEWGV